MLTYGGVGSGWLTGVRAFSLVVRYGALRVVCEVKVLGDYWGDTGGDYGLQLLQEPDLLALRRGGRAHQTDGRARRGAEGRGQRSEGRAGGDQGKHLQGGT